MTQPTALARLASVVLALASIAAPTYRAAFAAPSTAHRAVGSPLSGHWSSLMSAAPPATAGAALAWDDPGGRLYLFGGQSANKTESSLWSYKLTATHALTSGWSALPADASTPPARAHATAVWDPADNAMLVFDGQARQQELDGLWAYHPASGKKPGQWSALSTVGGPLRRAFHSTAWDSTDGVMLVFGGENRGVALGDLWAYRPAPGATAGGAWTRIFTTGGPSVRQDAAVAWDNVDRVELLFGGQNAQGFLSDLWAFRPSRHGASGAWTKLADSTPLGARAGAAASWDSAGHRLDVFGGQVSVSSVSAPALASATPLAAPLVTATGIGSQPTETATPSVSAAASATPSVALVLATPASTSTRVLPPVTRVPLPANTLSTPAGSYAADLWSYALGRSGASNRAWTLLATGGPAGRTTTLVYDAHDRALLIDAGTSVALLGDVWTYGLAGGLLAAGWASPDGGRPQARGGQAGAWDPRHGLLFIFGGYNGGYLGDFWAYKESARGVGRWALTASPAEPSARTEASLVWDDADNVLLLYGGANAQGALSDVWAYAPGGDGTALGRWTLLSTTSAPQARHLHEAVWDNRDREMLVTGGEAGTAVWHDLWAFRPASIAGGSGSWRRLGDPTPPAARFAHSMVWDPVQNRLLLFGGIGLSGSVRDDLWAFTPAVGGASGSWSSLGLAGKPDARARAGFAWDSVDASAVIFGGSGLKGQDNGVYAYHKGWSAPTFSNPPLPRSGSTVVFDTVRNGLLIYGGGNLQAYDDLWLLAQ